MAPTGVAGHGLPSGQIWALIFEPLWTTLAANETLVVATKNVNDAALTNNVRIAFFRITINPPRFSDNYSPYATLLNANLSVNTITSYLGLLSQVRP